MRAFHNIIQVALVVENFPTLNVYVNCAHLTKRPSRW